MSAPAAPPAGRPGKQRATLIKGPESETVEGTKADLVLVLVNRFAKLVRYIPYRKTIDVVELIELLTREWLRFKTPNSLVSDKGTVFTSEY